MWVHLVHGLASLHLVIRLVVLRRRGGWFPAFRHIEDRLDLDASRCDKLKLPRLLGGEVGLPYTAAGQLAAESSSILN